MRTTMHKFGHVRACLALCAMMAWSMPALAQQPFMISDGIDVANVTTTGALEISGEYSTNNSAPSSTNLPVLVGLVSTGAPTLTNGLMNFLSLTPAGEVRVSGSAGTTQYNEDSVSADAESLVMIGFRRCDTASSSTVTNGDRASACLDANGALYTTISNLATTETDDSSVVAGQSGAALVIANQYNLASAFGSAPTARTAGVKAGALSTRTGIPFVLDGSPDEVTETITVTDGDGAQTGTAIATVGAGTKIVLTYLSVKCSGDNTAKPDVRVAFDTDATFAAASTGGTVGHIDGMDDIPPGGGFIRTKPAVGADDEDLRYSLGDPVGGSCTITASYFTIAS